MIPSVAPCAVPASTRSISPSTRKLAGRLLGCTCVAALWLDGSVDELWAHERYNYHLKQLEWGPQEAPPSAQRDRRQAHTKRRHRAEPQVHQKRDKVHRSATKQSHTKTARHRPLEAKNATKAARSKSVQHSRSTASGRGNLKAAHAKVRTKTVEHRRQRTKTASQARSQSKSAGHRHSAVSNRKSIRAGTGRSSRTKIAQHRGHHDETAINQAPTRSAQAAVIPMPAPRPTRLAEINSKAVEVTDRALALASVPEAADARPTEEGAATYSAPSPIDQMPQPVQIPDRAAILERDGLGMLELPKEIQDLMPKNPPPAQEVVNEARAYLIRTSTEQRERCVGDTMARQGVEVAIGRLHPVMAIRIARSVQQARNEGIPACVYSAFRPPAFGVGGFSDKFNSAHAYGIAVDFGGIDRPGSKAARKFQEIAASNGLYSLYGPGDRAEWNHYQLIPVRRIAPNNPLRDTITATGPKDEVAMWTKSGVPLDKIEPVAFRAEHAIISVRTKVSHHHSHHRRHMAAIKVAPLSPFVRVQHTTATKAVPLSPFARVM
jgi:hypothetical protein